VVLRAMPAWQATPKPIVINEDLSFGEIIRLLSRSHHPRYPGVRSICYRACRSQRYSPTNGPGLHNSMRFKLRPIPFSRPRHARNGRKEFAV
jgi:hypothetical protein